MENNLEWKLFYFIRFVSKKKWKRHTDKKENGNLLTA